MKATSLLLSAFLMLISVQTAQSAKPSGLPGGHLNIEAVTVTIGDPDITIEINGFDFDFGSPLDVTLAGMPAAVSSATGTTIIATVPTSLFPAGDYLLTVSTGNGQSQNDDFDLTIGAVGPPGPPGSHYSVSVDLSMPVGPDFVVVEIPLVEIESRCLDGCELRFQESVIDLRGAFPEYVIRSPSMLSGPFWYTPDNTGSDLVRRWFHTFEGWTGTRATPGTFVGGQDGNGAGRSVTSGSRCFQVQDDVNGSPEITGFVILNFCGTSFPEPDFKGEATFTIVD